MLTAHSRILHGDQKRVLLRSGTQMASSKGEGVRGILDTFLFIFVIPIIDDTVIATAEPVHQRVKLFQVT